MRRGADGDITIGRQQLTEDGTRPNDIMLTAADRAISRTHCKIIYKHGFRTRRAMSEGFLEFLKLFSVRARAPASVYLPRELRRLIFSYYREPHKFYITDVGSVYGTYIRITKESPAEVVKGQTFLVGADVTINVLDVWNGEEDRRSENLDCWEFLA